MLVYSETKEKFLDDVLNGSIEDIVAKAVKDKLHRNTAAQELQAFKNSLKEMYFVVNTTDLPEDAWISIEYNIPGSWKRIDFIVSWQDGDGKECIVIVELKQWTEAQLTDKDGIVVTRFAHWASETVHPSYQASSYANLLNSFNSVVYLENIQLRPCAYLHNYKDDGIITHQFYNEYLEKAPLFLKHQKSHLRDFINTYIKKGDRNKVMYRIENGEIRPSKALADSLVKMLKWNEEFVMIDDQKVVYENALSLAKRSSDKNKNVLIVEGGPWTWKSVIAINLLVKYNELWLLSQYITKNAAPRDVYQTKLTGSLKKTEISNLFNGSWAFTKAENNIFDALIVDEAHRLNEKSGLFKNMWENQIKELINASKFTIFFIDEDQKVTLHDIWEKDEIVKRANELWANVHNLTLSSQFRCNGADGYLAWLDNILQIKDTANTTLKDVPFDFQIYDNPKKLQEKIFEKNKINNKARLVAGYCWDWISKKEKNAYDINFPEYDFSMRWNLATDGWLWIMMQNSVHEIWCIHTCQWLEVDYIGVIIGNDLIVRDGKVITQPQNRSKWDSSIKWYKKLLQIDPESAKEKIDAIIKNTYRTLMTRWMKWCYVYFVDEETREYFKNNM